MKTALISIFAICVLVLLPSPTSAKWNDDMEYDSKILTNRWNVVVGGFIPDFKTGLAVGSPTLIGTLIRLEDDLGLEEDISTGRIGGFYRFSKKSAIHVDYAVLNRSSSRVIDQQIDIGDGDDSLSFDVGALVDTKFDNDIFTVTYRHSFINNGKTEAGFTAGLSGFLFDYGLRGVASVSEGGNPPVVREDEAAGSILLPVPAFGMYINHAFTPKWILRMSAGFLNLDIGDFEGRYLMTSVTIDWIFTKHFGLGAGFTRSDLDFTNSGGENPFKAEYRVGGPAFYASIVF